MTPGSAGGELGNNRALNRGPTKPSLGLVIQHRCLVCPPRILPISFCQPREEFKEHLSLSSIYHGSAVLPSLCHADLEAQRRGETHLRVVSPTFSLDHDCLTNRTSGWSEKCHTHTEGESSSKLLSFWTVSIIF